MCSSLITKYSLIISAGTLTSRLLGLGREVCVAWLLGGTALADAFVLAMRIPTLLRRLSTEGALSLSLTAVLSRERTQAGREDAWGLATATVLLGVLALLVLLGELGAPLLVGLLGPGLIDTPDVADYAVFLLRIMLPYTVFIGLGVVCTALLHSRRHFLLPALAPAFSNLVMIGFAALAWYTGAQAAFVLSVGMLCGGIVMWLVQLPALGKIWTEWAAARPLLRDARLYRAMARIPLGLLGAAAPQLLMLVAGVQASCLHPGAMASLYYAERLMEFPLGLIGSAVAMASLPVLATLQQQGANTAFVEEIRRAVLLALGISLPAAVGLCVVARPLVMLLFMRGAFGMEELAASVSALQGLVWGIPAYALARVFLSASAARDSYALPCLAGLLALAGLCALLAGAGTDLLNVGLAVSGALWLYAGVLSYGLQRSLRERLLPDGRTLCVLTGLSTLVYCVSFYIIENTGILSELSTLLLAICAGVCIYGAGIVFLCPQLIPKKTGCIDTDNRP